jgi:hypothetical protein
MGASMSNLQMYLWFGVPWITLLEIAAIVISYRQYKRLIARIDAMVNRTGPGK